jgi:hypothetical protein
MSAATPEVVDISGWCLQSWTVVLGSPPPPDRRCCRRAHETLRYASTLVNDAVCTIMPTDKISVRALARGVVSRRFKTSRTGLWRPIVPMGRIAPPPALVLFPSPVIYTISGPPGSRHVGAPPPADGAPASEGRIDGEHLSVFNTAWAVAAATTENVEEDIDAIEILYPAVARLLRSVRTGRVLSPGGVGGWKWVDFGTRCMDQTGAEYALAPLQTAWPTAYGANAGITLNLSISVSDNEMYITDQIAEATATATTALVDKFTALTIALSERQLEFEGEMAAVASVKERWNTLFAEVDEEGGSSEYVLLKRDRCGEGEPGKHGLLVQPMVTSDADPVERNILYAGMGEYRDMQGSVTGSTHLLVNNTLAPIRGSPTYELVGSDEGDTGHRLVAFNPRDLLNTYEYTVRAGRLYGDEGQGHFQPSFDDVEDAAENGDQIAVTHDSLLFNGGGGTGVPLSSARQLYARPGRSGSVQANYARSWEQWHENEAFRAYARRARATLKRGPAGLDDDDDDDSFRPPPAAPRHSQAAQLTSVAGMVRNAALLLCAQAAPKGEHAGGGGAGGGGDGTRLDTPRAGCLTVVATAPADPSVAVVPMLSSDFYEKCTGKNTITPMSSRNMADKLTALAQRVPRNCHQGKHVYAFCDDVHLIANNLLGPSAQPDRRAWHPSVPTFADVDSFMLDRVDGAGGRRVLPGVTIEYGLHPTGWFTGTMHVASFEAAHLAIWLLNTIIATYG